MNFIDLSDWLNHWHTKCAGVLPSLAEMLKPGLGLSETTNLRAGKLLHTVGFKPGSSIYPGLSANGLSQQLKPAEWRTEAANSCSVQCGLGRRQNNITQSTLEPSSSCLIASVLQFQSQFCHWWVRLRLCILGTNGFRWKTVSPFQCSADL